jgi:HAD superfamily hydrolase (TIGR01450 family)
VWAVDLDGVVWLTGEPIVGAPEAIANLRANGFGVLFVTNNSAPTMDELLGRLRRAGIPAEPDDLVTSAQAAAGMLAPGSTALLVAGEGVVEALAARGVTVVEDGPADAVVVGWTHDFDFDRLALAARTVRAGARLIGTNEDPTHPTPGGLLPGSGALLAAVATAAGAEPEVAGKPHRPTAELIGARRAGVSVMVGDRPATDGRLAERLGVLFALVLSGVTAAGDPPPDPAPAAVAADLGALVAGVVGDGP